VQPGEASWCTVGRGPCSPLCVHRSIPTYPQARKAYVRRADLVRSFRGLVTSIDADNLPGSRHNADRTMSHLTLRPQDVVVLAKLLVCGGARPTMLQMGREILLSASEVHGALHRLGLAGIIGSDDEGAWLRLQAVEEFLIHAVKYAFPAQRGTVARGVPTAHAMATLAARLAADDDLPLVWAHAGGTMTGVSLMPLYRTVPLASMRDAALHELLALVDAIRAGDVRQRRIAEAELTTRIRGLGVQAGPSPTRMRG
jgi:hypothetical protein